MIFDKIFVDFESEGRPSVAHLRRIAIPPQRVLKQRNVKLFNIIG